MFYLPRICEHCLNPSCAASCPSGAIYKRAEDGIVLVDQDRCRGWRQCVTGCPYKKIYFNHKTGKAEKVHVLLSAGGGGPAAYRVRRDRVGRLRYIGLVLYDADAVTAAASTPNPPGSVRSTAVGSARSRDHRAVQTAAHEQGISDTWLDAARRSPVHALIKRYRGRTSAVSGVPHHADGVVRAAAVAVVDLLREQGHDAEDHSNLFGAIEALRIPVEYLAGLFTAGDTAPVVTVLRRLAAMRSYMRDITLDGEPDEARPPPAA